MEKLAVRIQDAKSLNSLMVSGDGGGFLSMMTDAQAVGAFVTSLLRALEGEEDETAFVASVVIELPFFASRIKLGKKGIDGVIGSDLHGLTKYEEKALEALKPKLKAHIEKGIAFAVAEGK